MNIKNEKAICIITKNNEIELINFYSSFKNYDIFFIIDNNEKKNDDSQYSSQYSSQYKNINFIRLNNNYVENKNYINSSSIYLNFNKVIGWDKALLFFYEIKKYNVSGSYKFIWFLENDVWFFNENTLVNIDNKYENSDLLTNKYGEKGDNNSWPWNKTILHEDYKYYKSMICGCRFSQKMLESINDYVLEFKTLFFIEIMFPTLAKRNNLIYDCPEELRTLSYNDNFKYKDFNKTNLFHPIKNFNQQNKIRFYINNKDATLNEIKKIKEIQKIKEKLQEKIKENNKYKKKNIKMILK